MSTTLFSLIVGLFYGYCFGTHSLPYGIGATGLILLLLMYIGDTLKSHNISFPWQHLLVMHYTLIASLGFMLTTDPLLLACSYINTGIGLMLLFSIRSLETQHNRFWEHPLDFCFCYAAAWKNRLFTYSSKKHMPSITQHTTFSIHQTLVILMLLSSLLLLPFSSWIAGLFLSCFLYHSLSSTVSLGVKSNITPRVFSTRPPLFFTILILTYIVLTESLFSTIDSLFVNPLYWGSLLLLLLTAAFFLYTPMTSGGRPLHKNTLLAVHLVLIIFLLQQLLHYGTHLHRVIALLYCSSYVLYYIYHKINWAPSLAPILSILIPCTLISLLACTPINEYLMSTLPPKRIEQNELVLDMNYILTYNYDNYEQWNPIILGIAHGSLPLKTMHLIDCTCKTNYLKSHHKRLLKKFSLDDSIERYNVAETRAAYWINGNHKLLEQVYKNLEQSCTEV